MLRGDFYFFHSKKYCMYVYEGLSGVLRPRCRFIAKVTVLKPPSTAIIDIQHINNQTKLTQTINNTPQIKQESYFIVLNVQYSEHIRYDFIQSRLFQLGMFRGFLIDIFQSRFEKRPQETENRIDKTVKKECINTTIAYPVYCGVPILLYFNQLQNVRTLHNGHYRTLGNIRVLRLFQNVTQRCILQCFVSLCIFVALFPLAYFFPFFIIPFILLLFIFSIAQYFILIYTFSIIEHIIFCLYGIYCSMDIQAIVLRLRVYNIYSILRFEYIQDIVFHNIQCSLQY